jgi:O-antigen biosynthesis protein WbqV
MQIASYQPAKLILIDICEYNLYEIEQKLNKNFASLDKVLIIADICDEVAISKIFNQNHPEIVFHAAALKHVNIVEKNICQGVQTNVLGTKIIADACVKEQSKMIMISTDKAVNPTNVMGASKRAAEIYLQMLNAKNKQQNFAIVRFGNVLGSSGSVIPLFNRQLQEGGPLSVTHPEMVRYFMTVREAVELVLLTTTIEVNNKTAIFVLDMGKPIKIDLLAKQMIQMAGLRPGIDIKIVYCGIRPGEKLYEELFYDKETIIKTAYEKIMLAQVEQHLDIDSQILELASCCNNYDTKKTISLLEKIVPEYKSLQNCQ